jgi:hypothetical protein
VIRKVHIECRITTVSPAIGERKSGTMCVSAPAENLTKLANHREMRVECAFLLSGRSGKIIP